MRQVTASKHCFFFSLMRRSSGRRSKKPQLSCLLIVSTEVKTIYKGSLTRFEGRSMAILAPPLQVTNFAAYQVYSVGISKENPPPPPRIIFRLTGSKTYEIGNVDTAFARRASFVCIQDETRDFLTGSCNHILKIFSGPKSARGESFKTSDWYEEWGSISRTFRTGRCVVTIENLSSSDCSLY